MGSLAHEIFNEWMMNDSGILFSDNYENFDFYNIGKGIGGAFRGAKDFIGNKFMGGVTGAAAKVAETLPFDPTLGARLREIQKGYDTNAQAAASNVSTGFKNAGNGVIGVGIESKANYNPYDNGVDMQQVAQQAIQNNPSYQQQLIDERAAHEKDRQEAADTLRKYMDGTYKNISPEQARAMSMPGAGANSQITPMSPEQVRAYANERAASYPPQPVVDPNEDQGVPYGVPQYNPQMAPQQTADNFKTADYVAANHGNYKNLDDFRAAYQRDTAALGLGDGGRGFTGGDGSMFNQLASQYYQNTGNPVA